MLPLIGVVARIAVPALSRGLAVGVSRGASIIGTGIKTLSKNNDSKPTYEPVKSAPMTKHNVKEKALELPKFKPLIEAETEKLEIYKEWKERTKNNIKNNTSLISLIKENISRVTLLGNILKKIDERNRETEYNNRLADRDNKIMLSSMFVKVYSKMSEVAKSTKTVVSNMVDKAKESPSKLFDLLGKGLGIGMLAAYFWPAIKEMFSSTFDYLKANAPEIASNIWNSIKEQFNSLVTFLVNNGPGLISEAYETIKGLFKSVVDFVIENGPSIIANITKGILDLGYNIITFVIEYGPKIISSLMSGLYTLGSDIISGIIEYVPKLSNMLWESISGVMSSIGEFIKEKILDLVPGARTAVNLYNKAKNFITGTDEAKVISSKPDLGLSSIKTVTTEDSSSYQLAKPNIDMKGLQPSVLSNFTAMSKEYKERTGKSITVTSANRSIEEQQKLYETMPKGMAAKPGSSLHNFGWAMDISSKDANELEELGLLDKYGFHRPLLAKGETWHIEPKIATENASKIRSGYTFIEKPNEVDSPKNIALEGTPDYLLKDLKQPELSNITSPGLSPSISTSSIPGSLPNLESQMAISAPVKLSPSEFMSKFEEGLKLGVKQEQVPVQDNIIVKNTTKDVPINNRTRELVQKQPDTSTRTIVEKPIVNNNTIMKETEKPQIISLKDISFESSKLALVGNIL